MASMAEQFPDDFYVFGSFGVKNQWHCELRATVHSCPTFHQIVPRFDELNQKIKVKKLTRQEIEEYLSLADELFGPGEFERFWNERAKWVRKMKGKNG